MCLDSYIDSSGLYHLYLSGASYPIAWCLCLYIYIIIYNWRRKWQPTPVFLPGESKGQKSLAGHGPWGHGDSDTTEPTKHTWTIWWSFTFIQFVSPFLLHIVVITNFCWCCSYLWNCKLFYHFGLYVLNQITYGSH